MHVYLITMLGCSLNPHLCGFTGITTGLPSLCVRPVHYRSERRAFPAPDGGVGRGVSQSLLPDHGLQEESGGQLPGQAAEQEGPRAHRYSTVGEDGAHCSALLL